MASPAQSDGSDTRRVSAGEALLLGVLVTLCLGAVLYPWFIGQAGIHHDPGQVQGFGGAFMFLLAQPFGHVVLGVIALGFVALGLHSLACARWIRLMGSPGSA